MEVNLKLLATRLVPRKFCPAVTHMCIITTEDSMEATSTEDEESENAWSDDSDDSYRISSIGTRTFY